jgi:hypothetical protein
MLRNGGNKYLRQFVYKLFPVVIPVVIVVQNLIGLVIAIA